MSLNLSSHSSWLHPLVLIGFEVTTTALIIGFTSPSSIIRLAALPLVALAAALVILTCRDYISLFWTTVVAGNAPTYLLRYIDLALLSRWSFVTRGPTRFLAATSGEQEREKSRNIRGSGTKRTPDGTTWAQLIFGLRVTVFPRQIGTPYEVRNVPRFSKDANEAPSRAVFLRQTAVAIMASYIVVDICSLAPPPEKDAGLFAPNIVPVLSRLAHLSVEELAVRAFSTLAVAVNVVCYMHIGYGIMAFVAVASGLTDIAGWRPPFGSPGEAYTLRRFWGIFWHQMLTPTFSLPATFITYRILHLPQSNLIARCVRIVLSFLISGLLHQYVDVAGGVPWAESGALHFFCTQALGIVLESCVQASFTYFRGRSSDYHDSKQTTISGRARVVGYIWTATFLIWSTPAFSYPVIQRNESGAANDMSLPFSFLKWVTQRERNA